MKIHESMLKNEERVSLALRRLYLSHGFARFKMSKFEEYDLYSRHKDFLVSDSVIPFTDTNGRLMALKPDVTLSIVKNYREGPGVQRVCYTENVYRISGGSGGYREIPQAGLECLGDVGMYELMEAAGLAAASLRAVSERSVLNLSHLGILSSLLEKFDAGEERQELLSRIGRKNTGGVRELCFRRQAPKAAAELLCFLTEAHGRPEQVLKQLRKLTKDKKVLAAAEQLEAVAQQAGETSGVRVQIDLSLVCDMNYYDGVVFQGFAERIPAAVLSGGQYGRLMEKMGKSGGAVGFAVYLDLLERLEQTEPYDVDVLLLYDRSDDPARVRRAAEELVKAGKSVSAQTVLPSHLTYREVLHFDGQGGKRHE